MATAARQPKPTRKGAPEPARRIPAWTGARASPTFSPPPNATRPQGAVSPSPAGANFPPLAQTNGARTDSVQDRVLQSLSGLTGTTVTLSTKTGQRYEGVVASTSGEGDTTGVTLKDVKEISTPGAPIKDQLFIASTNIDNWSSGPADAKPSNGDTFRTDTDISQKKGAGRERELQQWSAGPDATGGGGLGDDDTFGPGSSGTAWDQFAVNEKLFGVKTQFDENLYTTKLDRSAADFKERERQAQRIANEIIGAATSNPHIAEERNINNVDDSGINEEDKYGAVVRGTNAYVPPGARKTGALSPPVNNAAAEIPKVSVNGPDGATLPSQTQSPSSSKAPSPGPPNKPPADPLPAFRDFVTNEKQRLTQKRQALVKSEMDKRMAELVKFSQSFKLNKPIPDDLVPILAKDEEKQRAIREKASKDAASAQARAIGAPTPANAARGAQVAAAKISAEPRRPQIAPAAKTATNNVASPQATAMPKTAATTKPTNVSDPTIKKPAMVIQAIPAFKGPKSRQSSGASPAANGAPATGPATPSASSSNNRGVSPTTTQNRLNVNASSFRPTAKANAFTPGSAAPNTASASQNAAASASPKPKTDGPPNPFFGTRPIKKSPPVNIKDDFNPFKHNKFVEPTQVSAVWPYNGKRYSLMFPPPQHQPQHQQPHMPPPGPPPMPPPSYEEDSAAQAAARGYVYAYPPYGYPGQPMMQGMAPPPPGMYAPGPYMQPMQYPPGMPPPNAMYSPAMGQMPPPQAYMPPPPPGPYPPPSGGGPRPSMPPTPIPAHAHAYYHQSPQLQHAVPYHMMMPPPPNVPQHPYDGGPAPPVQMGGHA